MLSYHWFALCVGFGRSDWQRFRVNNVGPRSVLILDVPLGGGFVSINFARLVFDFKRHFASEILLVIGKVTASKWICTLNGTS